MSRGRESEPERGDHDRLLPKVLDKQAGGDGHDAIGDEEGERPGAERMPPG